MEKQSYLTLLGFCAIFSQEIAVFLVFNMYKITFDPLFFFLKIESFSILFYQFYFLFHLSINSAFLNFVLATLFLWSILKISFQVL